MDFNFADSDILTSGVEHNSLSAPGLAPLKPTVTAMTAAIGVGILAGFATSTILGTALVGGSVAFACTTSDD